MINYEIAKSYLDKQWSIFPVNLSLDSKGKIQKMPAIAWKEYQERRPTEEELHKWFDKPVFNGIGLITGKVSRIVVVDDDSKDSSLQDFKVKFYSPMVVKTISGGKHYYFKWTEELRNDTRIGDKPLDFRGDGGFVVLPPSSLNANSYTWEKEIETMYLSPLPEDIKKLLKIRKSPQASLHDLQDDPQLSNNDLPVAYEGQRNDTATRVAGILHSNISKKLWSTIGWEAFKKWNQTNCNPSLDERELLATWRSIDSIDLRNHPKESENYKIFTGQEAMQEYKKLQELYGDGLTTGFDELDKYFKFLPEQLYLMSAPTHHGKTTFALNLASRIASFGHNVLFVSLEQGVFIAPRVESILDGQFPKTLSILTTFKMATIESLIEKIHNMENKPKIVFLDHLHFIKKSGRGATEDLDDIIAATQNMAKELRIPVFVIAHVRKLNADRPPELDDLRDSSSLSQTPSVVLLLYRPKNKDGFIKDSYLSNNGSLFIAKNRIHGKSGVINFSLDDSGKFIFY